MLGELNRPGIITIPGERDKHAGCHCFGGRSDFLWKKKKYNGDTRNK